MTTMDNTRTSGEAPPAFPLSESGETNRKETRKEKRDEYITVRVSLPLKDRLNALARENRRPLSWLVNNILEEYVAGEQPSGKPTLQ